MRSRNTSLILRPATILSLVIVGLCVFIGQQSVLLACPFCSAVALTFTEQIEEQQVAVVAKLIKEPVPADVDTFDFPDGEFEIVGVLKGKKIVTTGMTFKTQVVGVYPVGQKFLIMGQGAPDITWTTPIKASERVFDYLQQIRELPASGPERLVFFQKYLEDKEKILAFDAYDEFAAASYEDLKGMKDQMKRERLIEFIKSPKTTVNRRRLYFTMLGVCGKPEDVKLLEGLIRSDSRKQQAGLDALIGCYLTLVGKKGLPLIKEKFLANEKADYVDLTNVMEALRFHATETDVMSTDDIVPVVRSILDHPEHADIVIEDLARWGDWTVMEKLVKRFKELDEESNWQRVPIIAYMLECPRPEAAKHLEELKEIDQEAFERASFYRNIGDIDDDDWGDDDVVIPNAESNAEPSSPADQPVKAPGTDTETAPAEPTAIHDPKVRQTLAEVPWEDIDGTENSRVKVARADEAKLNVPPLDTATAPPVVKPETGAMAEPDDERTAQVAAASADRLGTSRGTDKNQASMSLVLQTIFIPMAASFLILGLMWSVVNGWFERLIF